MVLATVTYGDAVIPGHHPTMEAFESRMTEQMSQMMAQMAAFEAKRRETKVVTERLARQVLSLQMCHDYD